MIVQLYDCFKYWSFYGAIWIISDPHFCDEDLRAGIPTRPSDEQIIKNINSCVGSNDTLICLGDVGNIDYCTRHLKKQCYKILIMGNHDTGGINTYSKCFHEIYAGPLMISPRIMLSHEAIKSPYWFNIHGHEHSSDINETQGINCCLDVTNYMPINLNQLIKKGALAKIPNIHRYTIDLANERNKINGCIRE